MSNQVRVIDSLSKTVLFETTMDKISDAYSFATQMEEAGLDIEVVAPSLAETLITSLGADEKDIAKFKEGLQEEIDEHDESDFGCAVCVAPGPHR
ncbi:MAG: hypothetical protein H7336_09400 [Bacteriovorax sp.]|nr:hypothetical protein [Bacteriovorax sp.]